MFVDAAKQYGLFGWGMFCARVGVRFGWCEEGVRTQMCAELFGLCHSIQFAVKTRVGHGELDW